MSMGKNRQRIWDGKFSLVLQQKKVDSLWFFSDERIFFSFYIFKVGMYMVIFLNMNVFPYVQTPVHP